MTAGHILSETTSLIPTAVPCPLMSRLPAAAAESAQTPAETQEFCKDAPTQNTGTSLPTPPPHHLQRNHRFRLSSCLIPESLSHHPWNQQQTWEWSSLPHWRSSGTTLQLRWPTIPLWNHSVKKGIERVRSGASQGLAGLLQAGDGGEGSDSSGMRSPGACPAQLGWEGIRIQPGSFIVQLTPLHPLGKGQCHHQR